MENCNFGEFSKSKKLKTEEDLKNMLKNLNYKTRYNSILPPPNPLLQRKNIPVDSPKFGRSINYV
jgi:hypothetical protein